MNAAFLSEPQWGSTSLQSVGGVWSVAMALFLAIVVLVALIAYAVFGGADFGF